uniref:Uncharacterized protein n=1 Tax=Lotus japonicus TaxID=34305 RepID=I3S2C9_LOTJA|nr:unknown [Lotus japonicus]
MHLLSELLAVVAASFPIWLLSNLLPQTLGFTTACFPAKPLRRIMRTSIPRKRRMLPRETETTIKNTSLKMSRIPTQMNKEIFKKLS